MGKHERLINRLLQGTSDSNIPFEDLRRLLRRLGFDERIRGDHHLFRRDGIREMINVQKAGKHAKPYQVRQIRSLLVQHGLVKTRGDSVEITKDTVGTDEEE